MGLFDGITRNVYVLGFVSFLTDVSSEMVFPLIPLFLSTILGVGTSIIGLISGISDSTSSLLDIFVGHFSDESGKRKEFVIAGYGLSSLLKIGLVFANSWQQFLVILGAERLGKSIRTSPRDAIIAESTEEKNRGKAFGFHRTMDTAGAIVGPLIAYLVLSHLGQGESAFRTIFWIALIPAFLAVVSIAIFVREPKKTQTQTSKKPKFWDSLRMLDEKFKTYLKISCVFSLAYFSFTLLIIRASNIGISDADILLVYLIYNIAYAVFSVPVGILSDRVGRKPVIVASFLLYGLICLGFILAQGLFQIAFLFLLYGIFVATDDSVNKAYISDITKSERRGIALGSYNSAVGAVYLPANVIFGILLAGFGALAAFGAAAGIALVAGVLMYWKT